jgi:hypothetical protein
MGRLLVTESPRGNRHPAASTSVTTERNRLMSWGSLVQGVTKPSDVIPSHKKSISLGPFGFFSNILNTFFASLAKLPFTLFKLGYEIAKLFTRRLSGVRRLWFPAK